MNLPTNKATMSSLEIAELTGRRHKDVMRAIRNMEPAWEKINGRKFALVQYPDSKGENRPMYELSKTECLYVATKFNDEARAKLIIRWEELETNNMLQVNQLSSSMAKIADSISLVASTMANHSERLERLEKQQFTDKPAKSTNFTPEVIDARDQEYDFAKVNGCNVRRIIINERVNYSVNDILQAIGVTTNSGQVAKKLYKNAPHTVVKIHIFGNTHPAWFCTKKGIELIKSGSRKLNGKKVKCELN
jgi:phage regulator Rha-like protein